MNNKTDQQHIQHKSTTS